MTPGEERILIAMELMDIIMREARNSVYPMDIASRATSEILDHYTVQRRT
jgi:hypothetical protein